MRLATCGIALMIAATSLCGCAQPKNPSFDLSMSEAKHELKLMREAPKPLERPVVLLSGFGDPGFASSHLRRELGGVFDDDRLVAVSFAPMAESFGKCRRLLIEEIEKRYPSDDPEWTVEVDVVGNSMGGLVARFAAVPAEGEKALKINQLMTIASPHQGAKLATVPAINQLVVDMRPGSSFIETLNEEPIDYELVPYARLGDRWVGDENTALPGQWPWWVPTPLFSPSHLGAFRDARFLADIARRLRDETPYTTAPRAPIPEEWRSPAEPVDSTWGKSPNAVWY